MKLIADSGSTKTDWTLIHDADWRSDSIIVASFSTQGITPIHQSPADIRQILGQELMPHRECWRLLCFPICGFISMVVAVHQLKCLP